MPKAADSYCRPVDASLADSCKSTQYCDKEDADGFYTLFLCRVSLGDHYETLKTMGGVTRAPLKDESSGITYDSVVTNRLGQVHREFITFEGGAVYPEYVRASRR